MSQDHDVPALVVDHDELASRRISVLLVDDEPIIREALARAIRAAGIAVVGEAGSGEQARDLVLTHRPEVVLMDIRLPGLSGIQTIEQIRRDAPATRILILTRSERNKVVEAILAGASGYILKTSSPDRVVQAILDTARGESVLAPEIAGKILDRVRELQAAAGPGSAHDAREIRATLTDRELQIFVALATGESNHVIGNRLGLSPNTVANHVKSILLKLRLHNRIEAAASAVRAGLS